MPVALALALPAGSSAADMYRWVDQRGVVNYSNVPPPAPVRATRIADAEPTVSVIPPPARPPEARRAAREAALERRIEQLEDELAQLRRAASAPAYLPYPAAPAVTYADYGAALVYPVPVWPAGVKPLPPRSRFGHVRGHEGFGAGFKARFKAGPKPSHRIAGPHSVRSGLSVRIGR
ncbi:MAG: DUF4124 domain-containing protein [Burkholderiales bacterium]|nr:DUF4124 domain-containing protein [Burkholderiales bacterium]